MCSHNCFHNFSVMSTDCPEHVQKFREDILNIFRNKLLNSEPIGTSVHYELYHCPMIHIKLHNFIRSSGEVGIKQETFIQETPTVYTDDDLIPMLNGDDFIEYFFRRSKEICNGDISHNVWLQMNHEQFHDMYKRVIKKINDCTNTNGAIQVHLDGNIFNSDSSNVAMLHVCDALLLFGLKGELSMNLELVLKSMSLESLDYFDNSIDHLFGDGLNTFEKKFTCHNVDMFYVLYSYYANYSLNPIRIKVPKLDKLEQSFKISDNDFFKEHQIFKLKSLRFMLKEKKLEHKVTMLL